MNSSQNSPQDKIVIIGAGCFGISTAYHLLKRGFENITIIERSNEFPAKDGSSNDINRVVRTSYSDPFYAKFAKEAIQSWKQDVDIWGDSYHESGVLVLGASDYIDDAYTNDTQQGLRLNKLEDFSTIHQFFSPNADVSLDNVRGYFNYDGGWAEAGQATSLLTKKVVSLGAKLVRGKRATKLVRKDGITQGIECHDGTVFESSLLILAAGPWTPSIFPELEHKNRSVATGQGIAMIQLTQDEADKYRDSPVVLMFDGSGFYCFPPTKKNILKMAIHAPGWTHSVNDISTPRTVISNPKDGLFLPRSYAQRLREGLAKVYPELANKPFSGTRLCWYNDSPDGDWIIGRSTDSGILFATAGSGHAFKFLPVIGSIAADLVQGTLDPALVQKFAVDREITHIDGSRDGVSEELDITQLCGPEN